MPRALVTGGAGFLGSHLCEYLLKKGHEVICMDNLSTGSTVNIEHLQSERFKFVKHDVTEYIYVAGQIDYVLHFASPASPVDYLQMPIQTLKVGALGTHKALGLAKEKNAAFLLAELGKRNDFREHSSPNLVIHNGQSQTISRLRPKSYQRQVRPREGALPGFEIQTATIEEGYSIQLSPLFSLDGKTVDAVIKCHIDQVERFVPISLDLPAAGGTQRAQLQVPQIASWRLHERFRWPADNVLVLSCGVVASPAPEARGAASIVSALTTTTGRADALLFIECHGRGAALPTAPTVANPLDSAGKPMIYKGRY